METCKARYLFGILFDPPACWDVRREALFGLWVIGGRDYDSAYASYYVKVRLDWLVAATVYIRTSAGTN